MEQFAGFPVVSAHKGFLDMLPSTGAVGLAILLAFCFCALAIVKGRARRHDPVGRPAFLFWGFYVLHSPTSSIFTEFYEITPIAVLAVLGLPASGPPSRGPEALQRSRPRSDNVSVC
jgi:O-antigen ligase